MRVTSEMRCLSSSHSAYQRGVATKNSKRETMAIVVFDKDACEPSVFEKVVRYSVNSRAKVSASLTGVEVKIESK
jgi:hypothetical protein